MSKRNNVYLVPLSNGTYVPYVQETAPTKNAVRLTREGKYPVTLEYVVYFNSKADYERHCEQSGSTLGDYDDNRLLFECQISNRQELIEKLLECGQNYRLIFYLWEHVGYDGTNRLNALFNNAYNAKGLICCWREDEDSERVVDDVLSLREFYRYIQIIRDVSKHSKELQEKMEKDIPDRLSEERFACQNAVVHVKRR